MPAESPLRGKHNQRFGLIETLRFEPGLGAIRMQLHLARMANSARHFGRKFEIKQAIALLAGLNEVTPLRLRLYLNENDQLTLTKHDFMPTAEGAMWRVAIARSVKLDESDPMLVHKTSIRNAYEQARAEYPTGDVDEVLLLNTRGHVCEGTITSLFVEQDEILRTPPISDGLLRGVLRQELLESGRAVESPIIPDDLENNVFFVGNSLRGLIRARLVKA